MKPPIIEVRGVSKRYQLGAIGMTSLRDEVNRLWTGMRRIRRGVSSDQRSGGDPGALAPVGKAKDDFWALRDVSLNVREGEVIGIIGRNGAGKSTLLKILSRITQQTSGEITLRGRVASLLEVGTGFHPELSGRENIYLNGAILGMSKTEIRAKFDEIVAFAEVDQFLDTPVKRYSSGMYVRLAFAVAAHLEPEILLVDEVLAVGDAAFQRKCLGKMQSAARGGRTVLFVSHNMAAVAGLCHRAILLEGGSVRFDGGPAAAIDYLAEGLRDHVAADLALRSDRSGDGRLRFVGVGLKGDNAQPVSCLTVGKDARVVVGYQAAASPRRVSMSLGFYTNTGAFLLLCNNEMVGQEFDKLPPKGEIECLIPRLPLTAGKYVLSLYCEVNGVLADWVQEAAQVDVADGDFFGTGRTPPASHGGLLVPHSFRVTGSV
jgi:lipopolysaccharide transport system ATP-binding protein